MISRNFNSYKLEENSFVKNNILEKISNLIDSGDFILGKEVALFESEFAKYCETHFSVGTSSGTSALMLAIKALNLNSDDEVIIPALAYISSALAVHEVGAKIVFCDIDLQNYNLDTKSLEKLITKKTKAIIPVHLYGQMADMQEIMLIAKSHHLIVVEDASQAHGAECLINSTIKKAGSIGDLGCFSLYPTKNLGAFGDAGIITTSNEDYSNLLKSLRNYGQYSKNIHQLIGDNARLDTLQSIVLLEKLKNLDELNSKRQIIASWYREALSHSRLSLPAIKNGNKHVFHQFVVQSENRNSLVKFLEENGIEIGIHYPIPMHLHPCFKFLNYKSGDFPNAEKACHTIFSLPMAPFITKEQVDFVSNLILKAEKSL